ncbi:MAG: hypothetical protein IKS41_04845 [Alphaproteobacteria bacterium]|nr:hypothetical protein [Alphaproteobacteria bacterium]
MMNKVWKYMLLAGVAVSMTTTSNVALGKGLGAAGIVETLLVGVLPVFDVTSVPAHYLVVGTQLALQHQSEETKEKKMDIRKRIAVRKKDKNKTGGSSDGESGSETESNTENKSEKSKSNKDWYYYDLETHVQKEKGEKVDSKLSKIEINSCSITKKVGEGVVGKGVDDIIITQGNKTAQELANAQQDAYVSAAGTMEEQALYEQKRKYTEQEQAIQLIAYAATVRETVKDKIGEVVDETRGHYEASDVKKDLDPESKKKVVEKTNDYNQALREYAYYSLVYDQLLSLEQQIMGLRLQAKGALAEQKATALSDVLKSEKK